MIVYLVERLFRSFGKGIYENHIVKELADNGLLNLFGIRSPSRLMMSIGLDDRLDWGDIDESK